MAPLLAALAFAGSGMALHIFSPEVAAGPRLAAQTVLAAACLYLVMRFWRWGAAGTLPRTFRTRASGTILICAWWIVFAASSLGFEIQASMDRLGHFPTPILAVLYHLAISTFIGASICVVVAALALNPPRLGQTVKNIGGAVMMFGPFIAVFVLSAPLLRAVIPAASPGLVVCLRLVIAIAVLLIVVRIVAAVMRIRPEPVEKFATQSVPLRIAARIAGLCFVASFFVLVYLGNNLGAQPDHKTGEYTVAELKDGRVHYMTTLQSEAETIASWTAVGSAAIAFAIGYLAQRREKKQASSAKRPAP